MAANDDALLEHNYDGIQEYDNPLPSWWVWIFWLTIIICPWYVLYYHYGNGPTVEESYQLSAASYFEKQAEKFAGLEVTEEAIWTLMQDKDLLSGMHQRFKAKCATCHKENGQGDACPNLTDDHTLHGGDLMEIYATIRDGVPATEMKSWVQELGPAGILTMAAYVGSLRGTHFEGGKAPEGKPYVIKNFEVPPESRSEAEPEGKTESVEEPTKGGG